MTSPAPVIAERTEHGPPILRRIGRLTAPRVAEIGVGAGVLSEWLLRHHDGLQLTMVDHWRAAPPDSRARRWARKFGDPHQQRPDSVVDRDRARAEQRIKPYRDRVRILSLPSVAAAIEATAESFDLVFIDADHRYEAVCADIDAWLPAVVPGGWIGGHDYGRFDHGVDRAVQELADQLGVAFELDEYYTWFLRVPCTSGVGGES